MKKTTVAFALILILLVTGYGAYVAIDISSWNDAEAVAAVFKTREVRSLASEGLQPFLIPDEDAPLMAKVNNIKWQAIGSSDLPGLAAQFGQDYLHFGEISITHRSRLRLSVKVSNRPKVLSLNPQRSRIMGGGSALVWVRKNLMYYLGFGPRYTVEVEYRMISEFFWKRNGNEAPFGQV